MVRWRENSQELSGLLSWRTQWWTRDSVRNKNLRLSSGLHMYSLIYVYLNSHTWACTCTRTHMHTRQRERFKKKRSCRINARLINVCICSPNANWAETWNYLWTQEQSLRRKGDWIRKSGSYHPWGAAPHASCACVVSTEVLASLENCGVFFMTCQTICFYS